MSRFTKNLILLTLIGAPTLIFQYIDALASAGFLVGTSLIIVLFSHDGITPRNYWDGMLLPIILLGCFFSLGIGLEQHLTNENWIFLLFKICSLLKELRSRNLGIRWRIKASFIAQFSLLFITILAWRKIRDSNTLRRGKHPDEEGRGLSKVVDLEM